MKRLLPVLILLAGCGLENPEWMPVMGVQSLDLVAQRVVASFDRNRNGRIEPLEWGHHPFPRSLDTDRDGTVSVAEYARHLAIKDQLLSSLPPTDDTPFEAVFPDQSLIGAPDQSWVKAGVEALIKGFPRTLTVLRLARTERYGRGVKVRFVADDPETPTYGITDHPDFYHLRGKKTFDGRPWDEVEGVADPAGRTGVTIRDLGRGHSGRQVNTFMHEFAHTLHQFVLDSRTEAEVADLYDAAKKRGSFLDPYAGANVWEYWAQGVEAYLMLVPKTGSPGDSHDNTPDELLAEDPDLYAYLQDRFGPSP